VVLVFASVKVTDVDWPPRRPRYRSREGDARNPEGTRNDTAPEAVPAPLFLIVTGNGRPFPLPIGTRGKTVCSSCGYPYCRAQASKADSSVSSGGVALTGATTACGVSLPPIPRRELRVAASFSRVPGWAA
jgi:hypothetical protein